MMKSANLTTASLAMRKFGAPTLASLADVVVFTSSTVTAEDVGTLWPTIVQPLHASGIIANGTVSPRLPCSRKSTERAFSCPPCSCLSCPPYSCLLMLPAALAACVTLSVRRLDKYLSLTQVLADSTVLDQLVFFNSALLPRGDAITHNHPRLHGSDPPILHDLYMWHCSESCLRHRAPLHCSGVRGVFRFKGLQGTKGYASKPLQMRSRTSRHAPASAALQALLQQNTDHWK